ncbi:MAG: hypothetical protein ACK5WG_03955 [Betaproteobacteria bacterium]
MKRRHSPYQSHDRTLPKRVLAVTTPSILDPPPLHPRQRFPCDSS